MIIMTPNKTNVDDSPVRNDMAYNYHGQNKSVWVINQHKITQFTITITENKTGIDDNLT